MKKVFVTRPILDDGLILLRKNDILVEVSKEIGPIHAEVLNQKAQESDALITMLSDRIDRRFIEKNSHLKIICNYAVGLNNIDLLCAQERGIIIGNTPDVLTEATAEVAFGLLISAARNFKSGSANAINGEWKSWEPKGFLGHGLKNKKLGIIGAGRIGKRLGEMAKNAFMMDVVYLDRKTSKKEFLKDLDFISLHLPLTELTKDFISFDEFNVLKPTAVIINTARGEVINQEALVDALEKQKIFACGLDVTTPEPLPKDHILYQFPNAIILPHIASATFEARKAMSLLCGEQILEVLKKEK